MVKSTYSQEITIAAEEMIGRYAPKIGGCPYAATPPRRLTLQCDHSLSIVRTR